MKKTKQYLVIGLGRFGSALARELVRQGVQVLAIDRNIEVVEAHRSLLTDVVRGDAMDEAVLRQLGVEDFDAAIVTMGDDVKASSVIVMHLKELGVEHIVAKAADDFHGRMLARLGADKVIFPERDMGRRVAHNLISEKIMDFLELSPEYSLMELRPRPEWVGVPLKNLRLRNEHHINLVAVRSGEEINAMPGPDTVLDAQDVLLAVCQAESR